MMPQIDELDSGGDMYSNDKKLDDSQMFATEGMRNKINKGDN
jgi:hypothetical protein